MSLVTLLSRLHLPLYSPCTHTVPLIKIFKVRSQPQNPKPITVSMSNIVIPLALSLALNLPLPSVAIPSLTSQSPTPPLTTPFSQSKDLQVGLENGKIRPCPSINPGCISTNPKSASFAFPWRIPENYSDNAIQILQAAILKTQRNVNLQPPVNTPDGQYLQAEMDGGFGRDVVEFLVKGDVVAYRCVAKKVTYIYPLTTAVGDSKGQEQRLKQIVDQLGWYAPSFDSID